MMSKRNDFDLSVYFVVDPSVCNGRAVEAVVRDAVIGGVTMVQLRNKVDTADIVEAQARAIQTILADSNVAFIINDHVALAAKIGADGVHIGQEDMSAAQARKIIGESAILGVTAYNTAHYAAIDTACVDYLGTGPFFSTLTKPDKAVLGAHGFASLVCTTSLPVVGIGGITPENANDVMAAGANGVAMMRSVSQADDVIGAAKKFAEIIRKTKDAA